MSPFGDFTVLPPDPGSRLNDGVGGPDGGFWVGSMHAAPSAVAGVPTWLFAG